MILVVSVISGLIVFVAVYALLEWAVNLADRRTYRTSLGRK